MSGAAPESPSLFLPDVEAHHQPGVYHDLITSARGRQAEYSKIWDLFAFQEAFTIHLARFTHGVLRQPATISPGLRELIAAYTSYQNECAFCTQAHAAGLLCAPSVGPGFDARLTTSQEAVRARLNGLTYDRMWKTAIKSKPDLVTVTSYNEWQEGTQIEPARLAVGKSSYDGAWGKRGAAAQVSYLAATLRWSARLRGVPHQ